MARVARRLFLHSEGKILGGGGGGGGGPLPETVKFYPDADPEVSSVDGWVNNSAYRGSWSYIRTGAGYAAYPSDDHGWVNFTCSDQQDTWAALDRTIFVLDTSAIPPEANILSATFNFYGKSKRDILGALPSINLFLSYPATNTDIIKDDYNPFGTIPLGTEITYADYLWLNALNQIPLNEAGLNAIIKGGITKFGLRESKYDAPNIMPPWASPGYAGLEFWMADKGDPYRPYLEVTYA